MAHQLVDGYTYLGTVDDSVLRYPWVYSVDGAFAQKTLAEAAIAGRPLAINDGYLVNFPALRTSLYDPSSTLRVLLDAGFVRILARYASLDEMPVRMAESGVTTFRELISTNEWRTQLKDVLTDVSKRLEQNQTSLSWPRRDLGAGFCKAIRGSLRHPFDRLGILPGFQQFFYKTCDEFLKRMDAGEPKAARTVWETMVNRSHDRGEIPYEAVIEMMRFANQAYHFNFTNCLAVDAKCDVGVETTFSPAFLQYAHSAMPATEQPFDIPPLKIPTRFPYHRGDLLRDVVTPGTRLNDARAKYLDSVEKLMLGRETYEAVAAQADDYSKLLHRHFGRHRDFRTVKQILEVGIGLASECIFWKLGWPIGSGLAGFAVIKMLPRSLMEQTVIPRMMNLVERSEQDLQPTAVPAARRTVGDDANRGYAVLSLRIDPHSAAEFCDGIPDF